MTDAGRDRHATALPVWWARHAGLVDKVGDAAEVVPLVLAAAAPHQLVHRILAPRFIILHPISWQKLRHAV